MARTKGATNKTVLKKLLNRKQSEGLETTAEVTEEPVTSPVQTKQEEVVEEVKEELTKNKQEAIVANNTEKLRQLIKLEETFSFMLMTGPLLGFTFKDIGENFRAIKTAVDSNKLDVDEVFDREKLLSLVMANRFRLGYEQAQVKTVLQRMKKEIEA